MGPILILIIGIAFLVIGYCLNKYGGYMDGFGLNMIGVIIILLVAIFWGAIYFCSMSDVADSEAFYSITNETYKLVITESENIEINVPTPDNNSMINSQGLMYFQMATAISSRIQEFGKEIADYNKTLFRLKMYNENWFTDGFVYDLPDYLKPMILNLK